MTSAVIQGALRSSQLASDFALLIVFVGWPFIIVALVPAVALYFVARRFGKLSGAYAVIAGALIGAAIAFQWHTSSILPVWTALLVGGIAGLAWWNVFISGAPFSSSPPGPPCYVSPLHLAADSDAASWIQPRLHKMPPGDVGSFVPEGFEAYARIMHPQIRNTPEGLVEVRWKDIAAANDRTVEQELEFFDNYPTEFGPQGEKLWDESSHIGSFSREIAGRLVQILSTHTKTPDRCWFGVWEGWGGFREQWPATAPTLSLPWREYVLFEGPISDALITIQDVDWIYRSANLWWPDDRAWFAATEIDFMWTYVGGSRECIAELLDDPSLEALPVATTSLR